MKSGMASIIIATIAVGIAAAVPVERRGKEIMTAQIERKTCLAPDGVKIVYSAAGAGETTLLFIHGGLADRTFYDGQVRTFANRYRVTAPDLAGHGESGSNRTKWGIPEFGADVRAVAAAEKLKGIILVGNSLGGPVAIEAALLLSGQVIGVVGIDTFQNLDFSYSLEDARKRAEAFRSDYSGSVKAMVKALFHPDADPVLMAEAERRMRKTSPDTAFALFHSFAGYDQSAAARKLTVPLRAINGDLFPTDVPSVRKIKADFDAIIMKHMGHYPMLERPDEFNRNVVDVVLDLARKPQERP
ncbi:MAG: alpha/beta hydrolase [Acidobacteriota bacterium]|jgi:pimeloyl-ACP methyl ester carboxylesterase